MKNFLRSLLLLCALFLPIEGWAAETAFDAREYGWITPVRDQGSSSLCWAYSVVSASEASILRGGLADASLRLHPEQVGYARLFRPQDPLKNVAAVSDSGDWRNGTGDLAYPAALFAQGYGPVYATDSQAVNGWEQAAFRMTDAIALDARSLDTSEAARKRIKEMIHAYGAVTFSYYNNGNYAFCNPDTTRSGVPHACTLIGWDDSIPADSFAPKKASQNGGWLVKNSYSDLPYFYLSYDVTRENAFAYAYAPKSFYERCYFYDSAVEDFGAASFVRLKTAANLFEAKADATEIRAVNVGFSGTDVTCTVRIYTSLTDLKNPESGTLAAKKSVSFAEGGYRTVILDHPVQTVIGEVFSVIATVTSEKGGEYLRLSENSGKSFQKRGNWSGLSCTPRIKAYAVKKRENKLSWQGEDRVRVETSESSAVLILASYHGKRLTQVCRIPILNGVEEYRVPSELLKWGTVCAFLWNGMQPLSTVLKK